MWNPQVGGTGRICVYILCSWRFTYFPIWQIINSLYLISTNPADNVKWLLLFLFYCNCMFRQKFILRNAFTYRRVCNGYFFSYTSALQLLILVISNYIHYWRKGIKKFRKMVVDNEKNILKLKAPSFGSQNEKKN